MSSSAAASNGNTPLVVTAELANKLKTELAAQQVIHVPAGGLAGVDWAAKLKVNVVSFVLVTGLNQFHVAYLTCIVTQC